MCVNRLGCFKIWKKTMTEINEEMGKREQATDCLSNRRAC